MKKTVKLLSMVLAAALMVTLLPVKTNAATLKLNKSKVTVTAGNTYTLKATTKAKAKNVKWSSGNKKVIAIRQDGKKAKLFAIKKGTAKITCSINGKKKTCRVTVKANSQPSAKQVQNMMEGSLRAKGYTTFVENCQKAWDEGKYAGCTYEYVMAGAPTFGASNTIFYVDEDVYSCIKGLITFYDGYFNDGNNAKDGKVFYFKYLGKSPNTGRYMYKCYF